MLNQEFMNTLSPVELQFFQSYAYKLIQEKVTAETQNYENMTGSICECPACHCRYIRKNGTKNHRQRYECKNKDCKHRFFTVTTGTFFYHSKSPYHPTVNTYCTSIYRKTKINSRTELLQVFKDYINN